MKEYEVIVGLEIHAELNTSSKIYCNCENAFGGEPNTRVCPVCMGMPGTLPVLNKKAVDYTIMMGHALNCKINSKSRQDRKNYFYPDLPKAYQISQADIPLCEKGHLDFYVQGKERRIGITRIHLEEDAGKLVHSDNGNCSYADYNRCGVPLIEIVTEPEIKGSEEAKCVLETIKSILKYLDICDCKMQEGSIRCDVNVSIREKGSTNLGTRCEMKNVNSFSGAVRAIEYEAKRQIEIVSSGGVISQETRGWDDIQGKSFIMRKKENAQDYRFFPEPDLGIISVDENHIQKLKETLPELPTALIKRYTQEDNLPFTDALLIAEQPERASFYNDCRAYNRNRPRSISNRILTDITKYINETGLKISETKLTADSLTKLIAMTERDELSSSSEKLVLNSLLENGGNPEELTESLGLRQNSDEEYIRDIIVKVLSENEKSVADYKNGKKKALGFLVGQCMKLSKGKANPTLLNRLIEQELN